MSYPVTRNKVPINNLLLMAGAAQGEQGKIGGKQGRGSRRGEAEAGDGSCSTREEG